MLRTIASTLTAALIATCAFADDGRDPKVNWASHSEMWAAYDDSVLGIVTTRKGLGGYLERTAEDIKPFEGTRVSNGKHVPFRGPERALLIGYGHHLSTSRLGAAEAKSMARRGLSDDEAQALLLTDLAYLHAELLEHVPAYAACYDKGHRMRARAVLHLTYTMGVTGVRRLSPVLAEVESGRYRRAASALRSTKWRKQVGRERSSFVILMLETGRTP